MAKKKKKQPARKREKGRIISLDREFLDKDNEMDRDLIENNLVDSFNDKEFYNPFKKHIFFDIENGKYKYKLKESKGNPSKNKVVKVYGRFLLPNDTRENLKDIEIENLNLKINKFSFYQLEKNDKNDKLKGIYYEKYNFKNFENRKYYDYIKKLGLKVKEVNLKSENKLIIGLGNANVYETSITLHHIYGIPFIPASAIKGMLRSYIIENEFNKNEEEALKEKWFVDIFGDNSIKGKVYFFDAFFEDFEIEKDIMNPHYPDYYDEKDFPTDCQNPRPINFLVVKNASTKIVFGIKKGFFIKNEDVLDFIHSKLKSAFKEFGIGAKTSVGYGYFDIVKT